MNRWRVYLGNRNAQCRYCAEGRTKADAWRKAFNKAQPTFRHYGFPGRLKIDKIWVKAFRDCVGQFKRNVQYGICRTPMGLYVEIRRI